MSIKSSKSVTRKKLEDLTKDELLTQIELMKTDIHKMKLQSNFYEELLRKNDPNSLKGKERYIENMEKQYLQQIDSNILDSNIISTKSSTPSVVSVRSTPREPKLSENSVVTHQSRLTLSIFQADFKLEINKLYIVELIDHELEDQRKSLESFKEEYNMSKFSLEAENECTKLHLIEVMESQKQLDQFATNFTDPLTGKIAADRYLKHIEQELKKKDYSMRKMKLKTNALKREYRTLKSQQQQKLELMGRLHPIDIEKLKIENEELGYILDEKTRALYSMKQVTGQIGQCMIVTKNDLNNQSSMLKNLTHEVQKKDQKLKKLEEENVYTKSIVSSAEKENLAIKNLVQTYKAPQILDYVRKKVELAELNGAVRVFDRRCKDQHQTCSFLTHKYQEMTSDRKKLPSETNQNG